LLDSINNPNGCGFRCFYGGCVWVDYLLNINLFFKEVFMKIYIDANAIEKLKDPDCLSIEATVFRNGGKINGKAAIECQVVASQSNSIVKEQK